MPGRKMRYTKSLLFSVLLLFSFCDITTAQSEKKEQKRNRSKIVCILPITGSYSVLGNMALKAVLAAKESSGAGDYEVEVIDTGVNDIQSAFSEAARRTDISFIVGPVPGTELDEVGPVLKKIKKPLLVFPVLNDEKLDAPNIVRYFYPVEMQASELVDFLSSNKRVKKFAVLHPDTKMGSRFRESYKKALMKSGKSLTYDGSYDPNNLDISSEIQWIETLKPDAVFIPDGASRSSVIIKKVLENRALFNTFFLGPGTWNSKAFKRDLDKKIDGIIYKTVFTDFIDMNSEIWTQFTRTYRELFGEDPGSFEYRVYDATNLMIIADSNTGTIAEKLNQAIKDEDHNEYVIDTTGPGVNIYPGPMIFTLENDEIIRVK